MVEGRNASLHWEFLSEHRFYNFSEPHKEYIDLELAPYVGHEQFRVRLETPSTEPFGVDFTWMLLPGLVRYKEIVAALILIGMYVLIIFELTHRTVAAMFASFVGLGVLSYLHERPSFETVVSWIDYETVGLLFGMMIMVGILTTTGVFEWAAVKAYKFSKGNLWHLTLMLSLMTAFVSAFLDNVTTILLVGPVTLKLCKVLDVDPKIMILSEVIFSNVGGTATVIGDPPNIILANHPDIKPHISFLTFSLHIAPAIILSTLALLPYLYFRYASTIHRDPSLHIKHEIDLWSRSLARLREDPDNPEEAQVFLYLENYIFSLEQQLRKKEMEGLASIEELEERYTIKDKGLLLKSVIVILLVVIMFFLHSGLGIDLSLAWIAVIGSILLILASGITNVEEVLEKVEFGTLMFFAALFVLMRILEELGLIEWIGNELSKIIASVPAGNLRLFVAILLLMWVSGIASAFIDNIPYTTTLAPVVVQLANNTELGLPLRPLVWALSLGTCLGGNGTVIGASANVVAVGLAEQQGYHISFMDFFKLGMPVVFITLGVSCVYMCIFHVVIPWD